MKSRRQALSRTGIVDLEGWVCEGTVSHASAASSASETEWVLLGSGFRDVRSIAPESNGGTEDVGFEDGGAV